MFNNFRDHRLRFRPLEQIVYGQISLSKMPDRKDEHYSIANHEYCAVSWSPSNREGQLPQLEGHFTVLTRNRVPLGMLGQSLNLGEKAVVPTLGLFERAVLGPPLRRR